MPFLNKPSLELFNDCLYYRSIAIKLLEENRNEDIFDIRRALRSSFISLWLHWEFWLNTQLDILIYRKVRSIKKEKSLDEKTVNSTTGLKRLLNLNIDTKLDLVVLLFGIDIRNQKKLMKEITLMKAERNKLMHPKLVGSHFHAEEFLSKLNKAINTTREFFKFWDKQEGSKIYDYIDFDKPVDMKTMGFGVIRRTKPQS
tara:strand:+ start:538 stop:1137 length:600 start_codon:yes stop_codon:yes gene_type:complete